MPTAPATQNPPLRGPEPSTTDPLGKFLRKVLGFLYEAAGWLAMASIVATFLMVMVGVVGRLVDVNLRGSDAFAGYFMAAATFLGLAHTLKAGAHIRVTLLLDHLGARAGQWFEVISHAAGAFLGAMFAWYSVRLAWQSWTLNDISANADAMPLWIPQISMAIGAVIFLVAILDEFSIVVSGRRPPQRPSGNDPIEAGGSGS